MSASKAASDDSIDNFTAYLTFPAEPLGPEYVDLDAAGAVIEPYLKLVQQHYGQALDEIIVSGNYRIAELIDDNMDCTVNDFDYRWMSFLNDDGVKKATQPRFDEDNPNWGDMTADRIDRAQQACNAAMANKVVDEWDGNEMATADVMLNFHDGTDEGMDIIAVASRETNPFDIDPDQAVEFTLDVDGRDMVDWPYFIAKNQGLNELNDAQRANLEANHTEEEIQALA